MEPGRTEPVEQAEKPFRIDFRLAISHSASAEEMIKGGFGFTAWLHDAVPTQSEIALESFDSLKKGFVRKLCEPVAGYRVVAETMEYLLGPTNVAEVYAVRSPEG